MTQAGNPPTDEEQERVSDARQVADSPIMPPAPDEQVLATLNPDGSRRWLRPRVSTGRFLTARRVVAYVLMLVFAVTPFVRIGGKPLMLLDLGRREFTFFGVTFFATDTLLLAFLLLTIFLGIFLVTALFGRVWCGWGCPQTVYMEFLYRPIERLFEGRHYKTGGRTPVHPLRIAAKYVVFFVISLHLAHTFLAYFVPADELFRWSLQSPFEHPTAFIIVVATTALMMFDFAYFREQMCTLICPYGRLQSVLLDRQSLIVSYDERRGEPRGKLKRGAGAEDRGDCIDCKVCVDTCPTGIDIREGLQLECVGCAQCIDACDSVMSRINKPLGLIRYSSQEAMETGRFRLLRARVVIYPLLLIVAAGLFTWTLAGRESTDVSFLRIRNATYRALPDGGVSNTLQVKIANRTDAPRTYSITVAEDPRMYSPELPLEIAPRQSAAATLHITLPRERFSAGRSTVHVRVTGDDGFDSEFEREVLGPYSRGPARGGEETP